MKKIAPIAAIALFAIATTSCKKDYTCECTTTSGGQSTTTTFELGKQSKSDAEAACSGKAVSAGGVTMTCDLK